MNHDVELVLDSQSRLVLKRNGHEDSVDVRVRRAFPWSEPGRFISIRTSEGKEVLLVEDLSTLNSRSREMIETQLAVTNFIPKITRVLELDMSFGLQEWHVETDRGPAEFRVQEREDVRFLSDGRFRIKDADGNIYEMPPLTTLDAASRKAVEPLL